MNNYAFHEWEDGMQISTSGKFGEFQVTFDKYGIALFKNGTRIWTK